MEHPPLDRTAREWRRFRALELHELGWLEVDIGVALGVSKGTVSRWLSIAEAAGPEALHSHPCAGCPPKMTAAQVARLPHFLSHGAGADGFSGDVLTFSRLAAVIQWEVRVTHHQDHVSRLLQEVG